MSLAAGKNWFSWPRLLALSVTGVLLFFIFRQLPLTELKESIRHTRLGWLLLGLLAYGAALGFGGLRSHIAYRLTERAVHATASCRAFFAGHFFYVALLAGAAGDVAKAAVYARWYQFRMAEVLAAAPLDRVLGFGGTILLASGVTALVFANNGFDALRKLSVSPPAPSAWILAGGLLVLLAGLVLLWAPEGESAWKRTLRTFRTGVFRLLRTPGMGSKGVMAALLAQAMFSGVFALNLAAVTQQNLYWSQIAWTFPAISIISSVPLTVAGAGLREAAALTMLGLYNVPAGECVAAALFTLLAKLSWAAIGGIVLWREEALFRARGSQRNSETVSIVIPTLNEASNLADTVRRARVSSCVLEIIVVDGGSTDATREIAQSLGCRVLAGAGGRGGQLRAGASEAKGDVVLMLHADTSLPPNACEALLNCLRDRVVVAGGFYKVFLDAPLLLLGSKIKCGIRLVVWRRIAGDQGLFVRREALAAVGGVPDVPLMEEYELCKRLRKLGRLALADATVVTSARRFQKLGVARTCFRMWWIGTLYRFGVSPTHLREIYERE